MGVSPPEAVAYQVLVNELVVSHTSVGRLKRLEDLAGKRLYVLRSSSYEEHLRLLNTRLVQKELVTTIQG